MKTLYISPQTKRRNKKQDNSIVTVWQATGITFYRVRAIKDDVLTVTKIVTEDYEPVCVELLPWDQIGVKRYVAESKKKLRIDLRDVVGKGVQVFDTIVEFRRPWLQSKGAI